MRRKDREVTRIGEILRIVEEAKILHLGLTDSGCPYVVPLHYGYEYTDGALVFFVHSAKEGHKLDLIRFDPRVCVELDCGAALISGGEVPCRYGAAFASVIGRGWAEILDNEEEKKRGLNLLMMNQSGRSFAFSSDMVKAVEVIKITVPDFTAKRRA